MWGKTADVTQPTVGNHEGPNQAAFIDYWHGRPLFSKFTFGGVLFLDLNSEASMSASSAQYKFVQAAITDPAAPACIVSYWHIPAISDGSVKSGEKPMWSLLANNGGDLVLVGHVHTMGEYKPLDANFNAGTADAHMVELIAGSGGHSLSGAVSDSSGQRVAWSKGKTAGLLALTLERGGGRRVGERPRVVVPGCEWRGPSLRVRGLREEEPSAHGERRSGPGRDAAG